MAVTATAFASSALGQNYVVLYKSQAVPADAAETIAKVDQTADPQPCPSVLPAGYLSFVGVDDGQVQTCQGGFGYNSWYGNGQVNALSAVTHSP